MKKQKRYYNGKRVFTLPIGANAFSFYAVFVGKKADTETNVRHEYGHTRQLEILGFWRYLRRVAFPSLTANLLARLHKLPFDYYSSKWEHEADIFGGVKRGLRMQPEPRYDSFCGLIPLFFKRKKSK